MDLSRRRRSKTVFELELPTPQDDPNLIRTFAGYRAALTMMSTDQLIALATEQSALIEADNRTRLAQLLSGRLSGSPSSIDDPVVRSPRMGPRPSDSADRGQARFQPSPPPRTSAVDLLAASKKLAPRIAAKLVLAESRRAKASRE